MNVLLQDWGFPPFDKIKTEDYEPAIRAAIAEAERNVEAIATSDEEPTFENTVEALECASRRLDRISAIMMNLNECCTSEELQAVVMKLEPEMTRFSMKVMTDKRLYKKIENLKFKIENSADAGVSGQWTVGSGQWAGDSGQGSVGSGQGSVGSGQGAVGSGQGSVGSGQGAVGSGQGSVGRGQGTVEQRTLLDNTLKSFRRHGVALEGEEQERYRHNEEELSELKLRFSQNALADLNDWTLHLTDEADLEGLPETVRTAAREEAAAKGLDGWLFTLSYPSYGPFMTYSDRSDLREKMYRAYGTIGNRGNEHDNNEVIRRIVELRAEQARLLGYDTYCDYVLADRMAQNLPNLRRFMQELHEAVLPAAKKDLEDVGATNSWDFSHLAEKLKQQRYHFDSEQLRPYFPLDAVREGIFNFYNRLYGLHFEEDSNIPVYHEDVRVYHVLDGEREMGLLYLDMHPRPSKRSGAWMTEFRGQHGAVRPQIQVVCNFSKPTADTPALLRFSEVETFMHEMGHAMHGMLSDVQYESLSGTNVKRDFVEMPSQVMENWCYEPEFLATFARHYQTGEPLPTEYIEKIRAAQNHLAGWLCLRQLNLGMTDITFHTVQIENGKLKIENSADADNNSQFSILNSQFKIENGKLKIENSADADNNSQFSILNSQFKIENGKLKIENSADADNNSQFSILNSQFMAEAVEAASMTNLLPRVPGCCTATNFSHIFGGGYASGYYGYKWAEVLDADIFSRFKQDGIFNRHTAEAFRREILSRGGTEHPAVLFRNFMGREPDNQALLKRMNLL